MISKRAGPLRRYRLNRVLGPDELAEVISRGSCGFLTRYQDEARRRPAWEQLPSELVEAACPGREETKARPGG